MTQAQIVFPSPATKPTLVLALGSYACTLEDLTQDPNALLSALLARDQVEAARRRTKTLTADQVQQIMQLDDHLLELEKDRSVAALPGWRRVVNPPNRAYWWFFDQKAEKQKEENDLPWLLLAGVLMLLTTTLTVEIIRRLWTGAPDIYAIFGTLLALLLTASPLSKQGGDLARWTLKRVKFIKITYRGEAMAGAAFLAFVAVLTFWFLGLPLLAVQYNNLGVDALKRGNLMAAQRAFQHAVAMDPNQIAAYHNLAVAYHRVGRSQDAQTWYQKVIDQQLTFAPSHEGLSRLYNEQGNPQLAKQAALAGLEVVLVMQPRPWLGAVVTGTQISSVPPSSVERAQQQVTRYRLLSDLGWAYYAQDKHALAQQALEAAIALEGELGLLATELQGQPCEALPHFFLAQIYEQQGNRQGAHVQWEEALRYLKEDNWSDREWFGVVQKALTPAPEGSQK